MASPPQRREHPMRVLCLGLPRTGTMTLQHALLTLGYQNVWHGDPATLASIPANSSAYLNSLAIKKYQHGRPISKDELERLFANFDALTDIPGCYFWEDVMAAYPDAQVVLVEREIESWYRSCVDTLLATFFASWHGWLNRAFAERVLGVADENMLKNLTFGFFRAGSWGEVQRNAREVYRAHYAGIRRACEEQGRPVLEFRLGEGWGPLCRFLGKEVPEGVEFPRTNDGRTLNAAVRTHHWRQIRVALGRVVTWGVVPGVAVGFGAWWYSRGE